MKIFVALLLTVILVLSVAGCTNSGSMSGSGAPSGGSSAGIKEPQGGGNKTEITDLMDGIEPQKLSTDVPLKGENAAAAADFAVELFRKSLEAGQNTLISPVSVLYALAMTANGAEGETLAQMEEVFGMTAEELSEYLYAYTQALPESETNRLHIANSIWIKDDDNLHVEFDFLQTNADYFDPDIYTATFNESTLEAINSWVSDNTDGMVDEILDQIPPEAIMYLVNAMAFDAEWREVYKETQIRDGVFTTEDGVEQEAEMMHSTESVYIKDETPPVFSNITPTRTTLSRYFSPTRA